MDTHGSTTLKVLSWNVNGLGNRIKRSIVLQYLHRHSPNVVLIQETHLKGQRYCALDRYGYKLVAHAGYSSGSRGVGILVKTATPLVVANISHDSLGRFVALSGRDRPSIWSPVTYHRLHGQTLSQHWGHSW